MAFIADAKRGRLRDETIRLEFHLRKTASSEHQQPRQGGEEHKQSSGSTIPSSPSISGKTTSDFDVIRAVIESRQVYIPQPGSDADALASLPTSLHDSRNWRALEQDVMQRYAE